MSWKKIAKWHRGLSKTLKFWDPKAVKKGVKEQWSLDPLGRQLNKLMSMSKSRPVSSARSYAYSRGEYYGPTGSIVGRY